MKYFTDVLKIGMGFERLFFFILMFFVLCHIVACLFIISATLIDDVTFEGTWLEKYTDEQTNNGVYAVAFYWTVTTITTVGYGDISGTNNFERIFCSFVMIVGVISFSFANGSLTSIIQNYD